MNDSATELEAAVFRRLLEHLDARRDVQNIDLMIAAGFCRNCLADWVADASAESGRPLSRDEARRAIYGMDYTAWKQGQPEATPQQIARMEESVARNAGT